MRRKARVGLALLLALALSGCGGEERKACREPSTNFPRTAVSIETALTAERSKLMTVTGALLVSKDGEMRLCTKLTDARPPACRGPSLAVEGLRDLAAFENPEQAEGVTWGEGVTMGGVVADGALHIVVACPTLEVIEHFEAATGDRLTLNTFGSNEEIEAIDFASHPSRISPALREKYGLFNIRVFLSRETIEGQLELEGVKPDHRGILWSTDEGEWFAVTKYDLEATKVALVWLAGEKKRTDHRWRRLDRILGHLGQEYWQPLDRLLVQLPL